jgi:hypothetical protein
MTKFEELVDIISRKKNNDKKNIEKNSIISDDDLELEVAGSESSKLPLLSCGDDDMDMDLIDQLYRKPKHRPNDGSGAAS